MVGMQERGVYDEMDREMWRVRIIRIARDKNIQPKHNNSKILKIIMKSRRQFTN